MTKLTDKQETDIIRKIADLEWKCHRIQEEYKKANSKRAKLLKTIIIPENKLLRELLNRLEDLKQQRRECLRNIKVERSREYRRKRDIRMQVPELKQNSEELKEINKRMSEAFDELNSYGRNYESLYNKGYDLYKLERDNPK